MFKKELKITFKLALPVSIGMLGQIMFGVVDSIMVGRLGADPLAASSLVNGLFFIIAVVGIGLASSITPLVAIAKGRGNDEECGVILREGFIINFLFSILLLVIIYLGAKTIPYMDQTLEVTVLSETYMEILAFSIIPMMVFQNHRMYLEGLSNVNPPMVIAVLANIANAFFNWVFIYGNLGAPEMGLDGAGWSTFFTRFLMAAAIILYVHYSKSSISYLGSLGRHKINYNVGKKIIAIGLPSGFQYFFEVAAFAFAAVLIGWLGAEELAAHQIGLNLASVTYMFILGISAAGTIRVADAVGKKDVKSTRLFGFSAIALSGGFMSISAIIFIVFRNLLPYIYIEDVKVVSIASSLLIIAGLFQIFDGIQATALGVLRGLKDVTIPMWITIFSYWVVGIPIGYYLGFNMELGAFGVWIGLLIGLMLVAVMLTIRFNIKSKLIVE